MSAKNRKAPAAASFDDGSHMSDDEDSVMIDDDDAGTQRAAAEPKRKVTESGGCYTVGANNFSQLGHTVQEDRLPAKVAALELETLSTVACGDTFTVGVTTDGKVFTWGKNSRGRLGRLDDETSLPKAVKFPGNEMLNVVSLSCSHGNTLLSTKPPSRGNLVQE